MMNSGKDNVLHALNVEPVTGQSQSSAFKNKSNKNNDVNINSDDSSFSKVLEKSEVVAQPSSHSNTTDKTQNSQNTSNTADESGNEFPLLTEQSKQNELNKVNQQGIAIQKNAGIEKPQSLSGSVNHGFVFKQTQHSSSNITVANITQVNQVADEKPNLELAENNNLLVNKAKVNVSNSDGKINLEQPKSDDKAVKISEMRLINDKVVSEKLTPEKLIQSQSLIKNNETVKGNLKNIQFEEAVGVSLGAKINKKGEMGFLEPVKPFILKDGVATLDNNSLILSKLANLQTNKTSIDGDKLLASTTTLMQSPAIETATKEQATVVATTQLSQSASTNLTANSEFTQGLHLKRNFAPNLAMRIQWMFSQALSSAEIMMDPPEMGPLSVKIQQTNGETNILFQAANSSTKDALNENLPKLREMLEQQGMSLGDAQVEQNDKNADTNDEQSDKNNLERLTAEETAINDSNLDNGELLTDRIISLKA